MVLYSVSHKFRSKKIKMDFTAEEISKIEYRNPAFLYEVLKYYKRRSNYTSFVDYKGLVFTKIENQPKPISQEPEKFLGACDKDWCNACRKGDYEHCPNRHS